LKKYPYVEGYLCPCGIYAQDHKTSCPYLAFYNEGDLDRYGTKRKQGFWWKNNLRFICLSETSYKVENDYTGNIIFSRINDVFYNPYEFPKSYVKYFEKTFERMSQSWDFKERFGNCYMKTYYDMEVFQREIAATHKGPLDDF